MSNQKKETPASKKN